MCQFIRITSKDQESESHLCATSHLETLRLSHSLLVVFAGDTHTEPPLKLPFSLTKFASAGVQEAAPMPLLPRLHRVLPACWRGGRTHACLINEEVTEGSYKYGWLGVQLSQGANTSMNLQSL